MGDPALAHRAGGQLRCSGVIELMPVTLTMAQVTPRDPAARTQ